MTRCPASVIPPTFSVASSVKSLAPMCKVGRCSTVARRVLTIEYSDPVSSRNVAGVPFTSTAISICPGVHVNGIVTPDGAPSALNSTPASNALTIETSSRQPPTSPGQQRSHLYNVDMADVLGVFEQAVLVAVMRLRGDGYGRTIHKEVIARLDRDVTASAVYATLDRLEDKGLVASRPGEATPQRGGRAKRHF